MGSLLKKKNSVGEKPISERPGGSKPIGDHKKLLGTLERLVLDNRRLILEEAAKFKKGESSYRNIGVTPELQVVMRKSGDVSTTLNIGFPFPVYTEETKMLGETPENGISIKLLLRGKPLRDFQRGNLVECLHKIAPTEIYEVSQLEEFRDTCERLSGRYRSFIYVDPYTFIGDSFIGLHFADNIKRNFDLDLDRVYSNAYEHLRFAFRADYYGKPVFSDKLVVIPDLIDNQWVKTTRTLLRSLRSDGTFFVIGRNLIVHRKGGAIKVYHFAEEDPLLRNKNIEDYMNDCLYPYIRSLWPSEFSGMIGGRFNLIINPFGREDEKLLPMKLVLDIIRHVKVNYPESNIIVVGGLGRHLPWIKELGFNLEGSGLGGQASIHTYDSLSEIVADIKREGITFGITTDTSLTHMFNRIGLRNITFYGAGMWDMNSIQSMASDSPLGFCRYAPIQIPVIFDSNHEICPAAVLEYIDYIRSIIVFEGKGPQAQRGIGELARALFDPDHIVGCVRSQPGSGDLIEAAKRISPSHKFSLVE